MDYYVYVLYSAKLGKRYIGLTNDLKRRLAQHNSKGSKFTATGQPWILMHYQAFIAKEDAQREERFLKTGKGRDRLGYLLPSTLDKIKRGDVAERSKAARC